MSVVPSKERAVPSTRPAAESVAGKPKCFVISPIGTEGSDARWKSDRVLKYIIGHTLESRYSVERADDIKRPGVITVQVIQNLLAAPLVVADLSDHNPNVYYELAIRHAAKKPVVHMIAKGQEAPFDVAPMRYISFDIRDPESVEKAQGELRDQVQAIEGGAEVLTPIQFAQIFAHDIGLTAPESTNSALAALLAAMENISLELVALRQTVSGSAQPQFFTKYFLGRPPTGVLSDMSGEVATTSPSSAVIAALLDEAKAREEPSETQKAVLKALVDMAAQYTPSETEKVFLKVLAEQQAKRTKDEGEKS